MKLARYELFVEAVVTDRTISRAASRVAVYRYFAGTWFDRQSVPVSIASLVRDLDRTRALGEVHRARGSQGTYIAVPELDAVVEVALPHSVKKETLERIERRLEGNLSQSHDRFKATHHDLTGLMNREEFNRVLIGRLESLVSAGFPGPEMAGPTVDKIEPISAVGVIAMDIDHFKQINDTYGHLYGDIILRALAARLETLLRRRAGELGCELIPAHPSGEEFLILIAGSFTAEQEREVAEAVRQEIGGVAMPTEAEWAELTRGEASDSVILPNAAYRRVTISLGIASVRGAIDREAVRQLAFTLKNRADIALYKAKTAGRNQVVAFEDIVRHFGRILEHHPETNIVAIDLGRHVNVTAGQEFIVYHPTFVGGLAFMFDDGRTRKKLGEYPRVSSGRIEVFQVQPEISFCRVSDNRTRGVFPQASLLEAVPVGSIAHLIPDEPHSRVAVLGRSDLEDRVREILRRDSSPYAVVFSVTNADAIMESNGTAFINRILAELYSVIRKTMPRAPAVGQIQPTQLACVGFDDNDLEDGEIAAVLRQVEDNFGGVAKIVAGVYRALDRAKFSERQDLVEMRERPLDPSGALEFARYATLAARQYDKPIVHFDHLTPDVIIYISRTTLGIDQTERDYAELERLGAINARAKNQLGLAYFSARNYKAADALFATIIDLETAAPPLRATFLNNAATNKWLLGDAGAALDFFRRAMEIEGRVVPDARYRGYFALVHHEEWKARPANGDARHIKLMLQQALSNDGRDLPKWQIDRLRHAMAELATSPP